MSEKPKKHVLAAKDVSFEGDNDETRVAYHSEMPEIPLLGQLLSHSQVIVRIRPWTHLQFINRFGISAEQMAYLAREGWVVPALYFPNRLDDYQRESHLHSLFDVEKKTGAQIDYFRQKAFMPRDADDFGEEKAPLVRAQLTKLKPRDVHYLTDTDLPDLDRNGDIKDDKTKDGFLDSATTVVARHLSYLNSFAELREYAEEASHSLAESTLSNADAFETMKNIMTQSRSNVHPLSGAFGGHLEPDLRFTKFWRYPKQRKTRIIYEDLLATLELEFQKKNVGFRELKDCPRRHLTAPDKVEWERIKSYLHKLHENSEFRRLKLVARIALKQVLKGTDLRETAENLEQVFRYLKRTAGPAIKWERFGDFMVGGIAQVLDAKDLAMRGAEIGVVAGAVIGGTTGAAVGAFAGTGVGTVISGVAHWLCSYEPSLGQRWKRRFASDSATILEEMDVLAQFVDQRG